MKYLIILVVLTTVVLAGCGGTSTSGNQAMETQTMKSGLTREIPEKTMPASPKTTSTTFEQVGSWTTDYVHAESYYVANPTKSAIRQFCEGKKEEARSYAAAGQDYILNFYDDKAHTPTYEQTYDEGDNPADEPYYICTGLFEKGTFAVNLDDSDFLKPIPE